MMRPMIGSRDLYSITVSSPIATFNSADEKPGPLEGQGEEEEEGGERCARRARRCD